jgi:hypothetical protein
MLKFLIQASSRSIPVHAFAGDRNTFQECSRLFATDKIKELCAELALRQSSEARLLKMLSSSSNENSSARGLFYEAVMHLVVAKGGKFEYKIVDVPCSVPASGKKGALTAKRISALQLELDKATEDARKKEGTLAGAPLEMTFPQLERLFFQGGSKLSIGGFGIAVSCCTSQCYLRPDNNFHPLMDAFIYPNALMNYKVSEMASPLNEQVLEDHLQCLPDQPCYYFDYIVPSDKYPTFKPAALLRNAVLHPRVAKTHVRVIKVEAKLKAFKRPALLATTPYRTGRATPYGMLRAMI